MIPTPLAELVDELSLERGLLEVALFKLVAAHLSLHAGDLELLPRALDEVEDVLAQCRRCLDARAALVARAALELGVEPSSLGLDLLITTGPAVLRPSYERIRADLVGLGVGISRLVATSPALVGVDVGPLRQLLEIAGKEAWRTSMAGADVHDLERSAYAGALEVLARAIRPSLGEFLS